MYIGVMSHVFAGAGQGTSRRIGRECLGHRDQLLCAGEAHKLHRVEVWLACGYGTPRKADIEAFVNGGDDIGPDDFVVLRDHCEGSLVSRRVEAVGEIQHPRKSITVRQELVARLAHQVASECIFSGPVVVHEIVLDANCHTLPARSSGRW